MSLRKSHGFVSAISSDIEDISPRAPLNRSLISGEPRPRCSGSLNTTQNINPKNLKWDCGISGSGFRVEIQGKGAFPAINAIFLIVVSNAAKCLKNESCLNTIPDCGCGQGTMLFRLRGSS